VRFCRTEVEGNSQHSGELSGANSPKSGQDSAQTLYNVQGVWSLKVRFSSSELLLAEKKKAIEL
jgi:hypothetical protein